MNLPVDTPGQAPEDFMKNLLKNQKFRLNCKRIIGTVCFLSVIAYTYACATYLFRGESLNGFHDDRVSIVGIKEEDPLDMIYVGGSDVFCYWQPLQAWNDYGFRSYDLGSTSMQTENLLYLVRHALKYQDPQLFVIGVRSFVLYANEGYEGGLRYTSDALDLGIDRLRLINTYYDRRYIDEDIYPIYNDIAKHHSRYELLASPAAWQLMDNSGRSPYKGANIMDSFYYIDGLHQTNTGNRKELQLTASYTLHELLDFCKEKDLNVLFVESPYMLTQEEYEIYNTIGDLVESYGFRFLNTNDFFDEMELDATRDFSDEGHVNIIGAAKYTDFLGNYIAENYDLPNHKTEENVSWDMDYDEFVNAAEAAEVSVMDMISLAREGEEIAGQMRKTEDLAEWCDLVNDSRFTVIAVGNGEPLSEISDQERESLEAMGLTNMADSNLIRIVCNAGIRYTNEASGESRCEMRIGTQNNVSCIVDNENQAQSIIINGEEYSRKDEKGINIVVFQNDYRNIADTLTIRFDEAGRIKLIR